MTAVYATELLDCRPVRVRAGANREACHFRRRVGLRTIEQLDGIGDASHAPARIEHGDDLHAPTTGSLPRHEPCASGDQFIGCPHRHRCLASARRRTDRSTRQAYRSGRKRRKPSGKRHNYWRDPFHERRQQAPPAQPIPLEKLTWPSRACLGIAGGPISGKSWEKSVPARVLRRISGVPNGSLTVPVLQ